MSDMAMKKLSLSLCVLILLFAGYHSYSQDFQITREGEELVAVTKKWPKDGIFTIASMAASDPYKSPVIGSVDLTSAPNKIYWKQTNESLMIFVKGERPAEKTNIFRITYLGEDDPAMKRQRAFSTIFKRRPMVVERYRPPEWKDLVYGGQFIDRFEPMPVQGKLRSDTWGDPKVLPRYTDNGLEDDEWTYWGGNALKGKDGKYHLITCRWPESAPLGHWHYKQSLVVHAVSDDLAGPYKVKSTLFPGHNPTLMQLKDGRYVIKSGRQLWVETDKDKADEPVVLEPIEGLAMYWKNFPLEQNNRGRTAREQSPMAFAMREDGSFLSLMRHGDMCVSRTGLSTYHRLTDERVYPEIEGRFEDPALWRTNVQYHLITHDWQGRIAYHMRSKDGIHWKLDDGVAYESGAGMARTVDGIISNWNKFEVIRINQDEHGRAISATFAAIDSEKAEDLGSDENNSKNLIIPLTPGKLLAVLNGEAISPFTQEIRVKIQAEEDFDPSIDMDLSSVRFGVSEEVNFGRGCKLLSTEKSGKDLILVFDGKGNKFTSDHFAGKLLGKTVEGKLLFGYSKLPGVRYIEPALSTLPAKFNSIEGGVEIEVEVQNFGQVASVKTPIKVMMREGVGNLYEVHGFVPPLEPYEKRVLRFTRMEDTWKPGAGRAYVVTVQIEPPGQPVERITRETVVKPN